MCYNIAPIDRRTRILARATRLLWLGALALAGASCGGLVAAGNTPELPSGSVLFQDDFSDPASGWERLSDSDAGLLDYTAGVYRIRVDQAQRMLAAGPGLEFSDVRLEVEALKAAGPPDDDFGLFCRAQREEGFYFFAISSDGYYGVGKVRQGEPEWIGMQAMLPSEAIRQGKVFNRLRADCAGDRLELYANGSLLASVQDADFTTGEVGLWAGAFAEAGTEVYFDNFAVLAP